MKILIALALIPLAIWGLYIIFGMFFGGIALAASDDDGNVAGKGCGCLLIIAAIVIVILVISNL